MTILHDLRYAWRRLLRTPSFALIALVTLAPGIGVSAAVFSVFHAVLLRPLPCPSPEQLVLIWATFRTAGTAWGTISSPIPGELERRNRALRAASADPARDYSRGINAG